MVALAETVVGSRGPIKLGPDGRQLRACGAVRISEDGQSQYSEGTQREAILARAHADGYAMDQEDIYVDHARGHKLGRTGYVAILKGVRERRYAAIYTFWLDRWGRDSIERQQRGKELDKLGVPLISITEGVDEPGLVRVIRAEMAEEEGRRNARRVMPNRERAAREGTHMARTPWGYRRHFPEWDGKGRRPAGMLVPHEPQDGSVRQADEVQQMFQRYATGQWSTRELASDLNARGIPSPNGKRWATATICGILSNPVYCGDITYNQRAGLGHYVPTPSSPGFVVEGKHQPLVDRDTFATVQRRLAEARSYQSVARKTPRAHLVAGLLRCAECGGLMVPSESVRREGNARHAQMRCANRHEGRSSCTATGYRMDLALDALLGDVSRLRGRPWTAEAEARLRDAQENAAAVAALGAELDGKRAELKRALRNFRLLENPGAAEVEAMNEIRAELGAEIARLEAQRAQLAGDADALPRLRALHARLRKTEVSGLVTRIQNLGERAHPELRDLLTLLVQSASVVERYPEARSRWLRLEVRWTDDVQTLLDHGLLWLDDPPLSAARPAPPDARTLARRERQRRYRAHQRETSSDTRRRRMDTEGSIAV